MDSAIASIPKEAALRLKTQIVGTMIIVILLPLAGLLFVFRYGSGFVVPTGPLIQYMQLRREVSALIKTEPSGTLTLNPDMKVPEGLKLIIMDTDRHVVYSNMDGYMSGDLLSPEGETQLLIGSSGLNERNDQVFVSESLFGDDKVVGAFLAILHVPQEIQRTSMLFTTIVTWFLLFLVFMGVGVSIIFGRFGVAVLHLERAAEHIADGDLDISIKSAGPQEIASLSITMDKMRLALKEESERRIRFLAAISHDLKTPLTSIEGYIEALEDELGDTNPDASRYVGIMKEKAGSLEYRVQDLLNFARASTGEWRAKLQARDLSVFLSRVAKGYSADTDLLGMNFSAHIGIPSGLMISMDEALVSRVLENLISNAIRYCPRGSSIALRARLLESSVEIVVEDDGPGIAAVDLPLIFEPYFRGNKSTRAEGSGLGLYIARSIAQSHGWDLSARSDEGRGTCFIMTLPLEIRGAGTSISGKESS